MKLLPLLHFETETPSRVWHRFYYDGFEFLVESCPLYDNIKGDCDKTNLKKNVKSTFIQELNKSSHYEYEEFTLRSVFNRYKPLYLKDATKLSVGYNRVVHGERGDYVEFDEKDLCIKLYYKFKKQSKLDIYYDWMIPVGHKDVKIYKQRKTVKYADYKVGKLYISPDLLSNFTDPEKLNFKD